MEMKPSISVIIPCYNKAALIRDVLTALARQTLPTDESEVLVVDDGSTDDTQRIVSAMSLPGSFRYIRQQNQGAATARNRGVREAKGDIILFLDGDVVADAALLEQHLKSHEAASRVLVMGRLRDLPHENGNLFYDVMHSTAVFDHGDGEKVLPFIDGFTGNLSLKRDVLGRIGGFDEEFPRSGFEDTEFIYRAEQAGFRLLYDPKAVGYHDSFVTFADTCKHMRSYQASAVLLMKKHPEIRGQIPHLRDKEPIHWGQDGLPLVVRKVVRQVLALPVSIWLMKKVIAVLEAWYPHPPLLRFVYWKVLGSYLLLGCRDGIRRYGSPFKTTIARSAS